MSQHCNATRIFTRWGSLSAHEKRVPMTLAINLVSAEDQLDTEKVLTENVSPHGARVVSRRRCQPGEPSQLVPLTGKSRLLVRVVYCERLRDGFFCLGLDEVRQVGIKSDLLAATAGLGGARGLAGNLARVFERVERTPATEME
jgi:hypothetical protein